MTGRVVAIVPGRRGRLDIDLGGWSDDDRRDVIRPPVRPPIRVPVRPDGHPEARPDEARAAMAEAVPAMAEAMATMPAAASAMPAAVSTPPRVPWYRAHHEQGHQQPEQYHPLPPHARGLVPVVHHAPLPLLITPYAGFGRRPCLSSPTPTIPHKFVPVETHRPFSDTLRRRQARPAAQRSWRQGSRLREPG